MRQLSIIKITSYQDLYQSYDIHKQFLSHFMSEQLTTVSAFLISSVISICGVFDNFYAPLPVSVLSGLGV